MQPPHRPPGRPRLLPPVAACLAVVALWLGAVWVGTAITQEFRPPACSGLGFGCELDAGAATLLTGVVVGVPALATGCVATVIGWATSSRLGSPTARRWAVWGAPAVLVAAAVIHAVGATAAGLLA